MDLRRICTRRGGSLGGIDGVGTGLGLGQTPPSLPSAMTPPLVKGGIVMGHGTYGTMGQMIDLTQQNKKIKKPLQKKKAAIKRGRAREIDEVFEAEEKEEKNTLQQIDRPQDNNNDKFIIFKQLLVLLVLAVLFFVGFKIFFRPADKQDNQKQLSERWYMVKLTDGEIFYGQIKDTASDPVIINNVYYDYDQLNGEEGKKEKSNNLRLVKRGKETYGPDGTIHIIRDQILYMEPLREDSKVLRAILENEGE